MNGWVFFHQALPDCVHGKEELREGQVSTTSRLELPCHWAEHKPE